jgi:hypothetical protein
MKRIAFHLLLALALILQGATGAFAATSSPITRASCCPHGMSYADMAARHSHCPCPQQQTCASDCHLMCAAGAVLLAPPAFVAQWAPAFTAAAIQGGTSLPPRSDTPPIRPPIA